MARYAANAIAYAAAPNQKVAAMPRLIASTTAMTEAHTEVAPLMPHSHGANLSALLTARLMPRGNAIPMKNPIGNRRSAEMIMRTGVDAPANVDVIGVVRNPKRIKRTSKAMKMRFGVSPAVDTENMLPVPLASKSVNRTTESP